MLCKCSYIVRLPLLAKAHLRYGNTRKGLLPSVGDSFQFSNTTYMLVNYNSSDNYFDLCLPLCMSAFLLFTATFFLLVVAAYNTLLAGSAQAGVLPALAVTYLQRSRMTFIVTLGEYACSRTASQCKHRKTAISEVSSKEESQKADFNRHMIETAFDRPDFIYH